MKMTRFTRSFGLAAVLSLAAAACSDISSPTMVPVDEDPILDAGTADGIFDAGPLFRALGPSFSVSTQLYSANGFLIAAADGDDTHLRAARRKKRLEDDEVKTKSIDPAKGGTIDLKKAGMKIVIPAGALSGTADVDITVHAYAGKYHVYEFLPHGLVFNTPIRVEFDITNVQKFAKELEKRLKKLEKEADKLAKCDEDKAEGKELSKKCAELYEDWAEYEEDATWYEAAVDATGFVGVYFTGDVHNNGGLHAEELFPVQLDDDELVFETTHFSGYALAM